MRVQCNQCGRMFEVAQSQTNRALKCVCKNIFIATPMLEEIKPNRSQTRADQPSDQDENRSVSSHSQTLSDDIGADPTVSANAASEEEIDDYINFLKGSRQSSDPSAQTPGERISGPHLNQMQAPEVDAGWSRNSSLFDSLPNDLPASEKDPEVARKVDERPQQIQNRISKPQRKDLARTKNEATLPKTKLPYSYLVGGGFIIVATTFLIIRFTPGKRVEEEKIDPYLSRLLSQKEEVAKTQAAQEHQLAGNTVIQTRPVEPYEASKQSEILKTEIEDSELYEKFIMGEFEDIVRTANKRKTMSAVDRSFLLEALAQRAGSNRDRLFRLLDEAKSYREITGNAPHLVRSESAIRTFLATSTADLNKPLEILTSLSRTQPRDPLVFAYLGLALHRINRQDLSERAWDQALAIEPNFFWLLQIRKDIAINEKNWNLGEKIAKRITSIEGYEAYGYREIARIFSLQGKTEDAIDALNKSSQISPSASGYIALGKLQKDRSVTLAIQSFEKALKQKPSTAETAEASILIARLLCDNEKGAQASTFFRMHLNENMSKSIMVEKAECEIKSGLLKRAIDTYESALKLAPKDPNMWLRYGDSLYRNAKFRAALEAAQTSLKWKESEAGRFLAARSLAKLNNPKEAHKHLTKILQSNPKNREASTLLKSLH